MKAKLLFLLIISQYAIAQKVEFGEVTTDELKEEFYQSDKSANAVILYKKQDTYFMSTNGLDEIITEIHQRIKIYNKAGFDYATEQINLFKAGSSSERITKLDAYTYNLENGEIVKTKLEKDQIFENEVNYNYQEVKFTMPNVKEGSVIEFKYKLRSPFIWNIDEFKFQYLIPIKKLEAEIRTPKGFNYKQTYKGYVSVFPTKSLQVDNRLGMDVEVNKFFLNNVPALKQENYVDNMDNYRTGVMFELVSINLPGYFRSYSQSWSDVARSIGNSDDFKNQLDKTKSFDENLDILLSGENDQLKKMEIIFKYVKDNIIWNGIDGKYFYNGIKKALKEKKGNVGDINLSLVAMLRYAGINANPVVISTKDNGIPFFPTLERLNYVIVYAVINEKEYFLDATDEFSDVNILPIKDYNWRGVLVDSKNMVWNLIDIKDPDLSQNYFVVNGNLSLDGELKGTLKSRYTNHSAFQFRKKFKDKNIDSHIASIENNYEDMEISNYEVTNTDDFKGFVSESFEFNLENAATKVGEDIYIKPLSFLRTKINPFTEEERMYPMDFGYPYKATYAVSITIPDGYEVLSSPKPTIIELPNKLGSYKYLINGSMDNIQLSINFELNQAYISAENYLFIKEFFNQMIIKEEEQVVLKKI